MMMMLVHSTGLGDICDPVPGAARGHRGDTQGSALCSSGHGGVTGGSGQGQGPLLSQGTPRFREPKGKARVDGHAVTDPPCRVCPSWGDKEQLPKSPERPQPLPAPAAPHWPGRPRHPGVFNWGRAQCSQYRPVLPVPPVLPVQRGAGR